MRITPETQKMNEAYCWVARLTDCGRPSDRLLREWHAWMNSGNNRTAFLNTLETWTILFGSQDDAFVTAPEKPTTNPQHDDFASPKRPTTKPDIREAVVVFLRRRGVLPDEPGL